MSSEPDLSSRGPAPSPKAPYEDQWNYTERTLNDHLHGRVITPVEYMNSYAAIYNMCCILPTRPDESIPYRTRLYEDFQNHHTVHLETAVQPTFAARTGRDLIHTYLEQQTAFLNTTKFNLKLFRYFDRNFTIKSEIADLNRVVNTEWKRIVFDPLMNREEGLNDAIRQEVARAVDEDDTDSQRLMRDMVNSLFALSYDVVVEVIQKPYHRQLSKKFSNLTGPQKDMLLLRIEFRQAVNKHITTLGLDPEGPIDWPWTTESSSLTVLTLYLHQLLASTPPLSSVVLNKKNLWDCKEALIQVVMARTTLYTPSYKELEPWASGDQLKLIDEDE